MMEIINTARRFLRPAMTVDPRRAYVGSDDDCPIVAIPQGQAHPGDWPDDPDEVPEWRIALEIAASIYNRKLPPYRTRREFESHVELAHAAIESAHARAMKPALSPDDAAAEFVAMLRTTGRTGEYMSADIYAAYINHCTAENRTPCGEKAFKMSLERTPGCSSRLRNQMRNGIRYRPTVWTIDAAEEDIRMAA